MKRLINGVAALALMTAPVALSATNGVLQIGYGVKSKGMGGVGIAYPQDSFSAIANPAGMAGLGCRGDIGLHYLVTNGRYRCDSATVFGAVQVVNPGANQTLGATTAIPGLASGFHTDQDNWLPELGAIWMVSCNQAFGLAFYEVGQWRVRSNNDFAVRTQFSGQSFRADKVVRHFNSELDVYAITPSWSWQINCAHSIGLSVSAVAGRLKFTAQNLVLPSESVEPGKIQNQGQDWEWGFNARFGWQGTFCDCLTLGLTYQTRTWMDTFRKYSGFIPERGQADLTSQFGVGASWAPIPCLLIAGEAIKVFYDYGKWFENTDLNDRGLFGANNGPGLGWNDQLIWKVGAAYAFSDAITLRAGYNYGKSPLPEGNILNLVTMAAVEHHVSLGGSLVFCCNQELSLVYYHGFENDVVGKDPNSADENNSAVLNKFRANVNSVGVSWGMCF